jgi:uncharacterized protein (TIGR02001 family)
MKNLLLASAAAGLLALPAAPVFAQAKPDYSLSANLGIASNYIFRGISQTGGKPAVQGGFDFAHDSGFYAGTWLSNISWLEDFNAYTHSSLEWDFYGGFKRNIGDTDFYYDLSTIYYYYPGSTNPGVTSANTWELAAAFGWKFLGVKYSWAATNYFGAKPTGQDTNGSWYLDFFANYPVGETGLAVFGDFGILKVRNDGQEITANKASYNNWKIGASYTLPSGPVKGLEIGAFYSDTNVKNSALTGTNFYTDCTGVGGVCNGYNTAKAVGVVYLKKAF